MADLDDFFAKKDRKKSKSKKFSTADELAKKLDDTKQKSELRPKKDRPIQEGDESGRIGEEDEWKEYEEPVKDYTGLKIQVLQGGPGAPDSGRDSGGEELVSDSSRPKGPWNKPHQEQEAEAPAVAEAEAPAPAPQPEVRPRDNKYVVPAARRNPVQPTVRRQHPKHAPDINNSTYFPELGAGPRRQGWGAPGAPPATGAQPEQVALGNRYTTLQNDT